MLARHIIEHELLGLDNYGGIKAHNRRLQYDLELCDGQYIMAFQYFQVDDDYELQIDDGAELVVLV